MCTTSILELGIWRLGKWFFLAMTRRGGWTNPECCSALTMDGRSRETAAAVPFRRQRPRGPNQRPNSPLVRVQFHILPKSLRACSLCGRMRRDGRKPRKPHRQCCRPSSAIRSTQQWQSSEICTMDTTPWWRMSRIPLISTSPTTRWLGGGTERSHYLLRCIRVGHGGSPEPTTTPPQSALGSTRLATTTISTLLISTTSFLTRRINRSIDQ